MDKKELEIMSPAGNFECLYAAIQGGADSVYFGVGNLNMRSHSANNFTPDDLPRIVEVCREYGVKTYMTLKSVLYSEDLAPMREALDAAKAAEYKEKAMAELSAKGVTFPVEVDYYIQGSSQTALDTANVLKQMFSDYLGDDFVVLNIKTYISSLATEVRNPRLASFFINGWGADYGDPQNYLGQETYGQDNAYYSVSYSKKSYKRC